MVNGPKKFKQLSPSISLSVSSSILSVRYKKNKFWIWVLNFGPDET